MCRRQDLRDAFCCAFGLLIHGKLIGPNCLILVDSALHVPACEVSAVGTRKSSRSKTANRSTLPVAIVNHASRGQSRFSATCIFEGKTDWTLPCCFRNRVSGKKIRCRIKGNKQQTVPGPPKIHRNPLQPIAPAFLESLHRREGRYFIEA